MPIVGDYLQRPTYEVLHTIGEGNVGICRLARHDIFDCNVVQKTISLLGIPDGVAREPHLLKEAQHKYLIKVWDAQWEPSPQFKGMEAVTFICDYYPGKSVYDALMDLHVFGLAGAMRICGQMLDALAYLHGDRAYVHRDIKPANILLDESRENAVLADLGSAGKIDPHGGTAPNYGGTPLYLAPEVHARNQVTAKSDLYAIGMVTIEMLAGRFPYEDIARSKVDARLASGKPALPDRYFVLPPYVPPNVKSFIRSLIRVDPSKRPATARAALQKLNGLRYVDWRRTLGTGLVGEWIGSWPPDKVPEKRRIYRVQSSTVKRKGHVEQIKLTAAWRRPAGTWRKVSKLERYVDREDAKALSVFFRDVEDAAHAAPA
ncbi:serine/threonine-protein kinase [Stackebrandtia nassauensis]|uniref:non-specific serine/threonine protein kinase n=1 Tax=Stackebrandtia nassauensis (strain DSM 44728 / CIP 108903 / NRRL B-16338 / NBRC 102104 / LLR-40K-21) TaxID=446470 RepID=D3PVV2_STANL|nr:serine/threonine-protein kinase [Stackebrandtia nassauensis]ADD45073.1 serine/threonine protein kinase [Stackebrandtia nassauensis DSM 44728]